MLVIDANAGKVEKMTKTEFKEKFEFPPHAHHTFEQIWDSASELGIYAFDTKKDAIEWLLNDIPYYLELNPERCKSLFKVLSQLLGFQVLTAKY